MKISTSATTKFLLLVFLLSSGFFMSAGKVEAATANWAYQISTGYSNCSSGYGSESTCTAYDYNGLCTAYAAIPLVSPYNIWDTYYTTTEYPYDTLTYRQCQSSSMTYGTAASFSATDGAIDTYAPGATVSVSVLGGGGGGNTFNGWSGSLNIVACWLFGCSSPPTVGVSAYYGGVDVSHCEASGSCTNSGTFTAPTTPGAYSINLTGCWYSNSNCANSSMTFNVACPSGQSWNGSSCAVPTPVPVVTYVTWTPSIIAYGGNTTLSYNSTNNPTSCNLTATGGSTYNGGIGTSPMPYSQGISNLTSNTGATIACTNAGGTSSGVSANLTVCASGQVVSGGACVTPTVGSCGTANGRVYANGSSSYSPYTQCGSGGTASVTSFPTAGNTTSWTCSGTNGGSSSPTCSASQTAPSTCTLPWGGSIASGASVTAYQASSVVSPATCSSQLRTCTNGVLSGSYTNQACAVTAAAPTASLTASPNPVAYNGQSTLTWSSSNATSCTASGPWSNSGTLSGSGWSNPLTTNTTFTFQCTGPGGTSALQSVTVTVGTAPVNGSCSVTHFSCAAGSSTSNATGSGSWTWSCAGSNGGTTASCSETMATCTLPWGGTLASGNSVTAYQSSSVVSPATCTSETRTCTNGVLSGSYTNQSCAVTAAVPTVTTSAVSSITQTTATSGGTISSDGGSTVTVSGIVWSTSSNPTTANSKTTDGWAIGGPWSDSISGLTLGTIYHVRAYATNSVGTAYGADVQFTTTGATSCIASTINNCSLTGVSSGGSSGSCSSGYVGACSYSCSNGTWNMNSNSCAVPATCTTPWGSTVADGVSVQAFSVASVATPSACPAPQTRTCTNGVLSGSYQYVNCVIITPTINTFSAVPTRTRSGGALTVSWSTTSAISCAVTRNGVAKWSGTSGTNIPDTIASQTTYIITCLTGGAPMTKSLTVNVVPTFYEF